MSGVVLVVTGATASCPECTAQLRPTTDAWRKAECHDCGFPIWRREGHADFCRSVPHVVEDRLQRMWAATLLAHLLDVHHWSLLEASSISVVPEAA